MTAATAIRDSEDQRKMLTAMTVACEHARWTRRSRQTWTFQRNSPQPAASFQQQPASSQQPTASSQQAAAAMTAATAMMMMMTLF